MDYFSPRTPAAGGQSSYADSRHLEPGTGNGEGAKSPSYFTTSNGGKSGGNHLAKVDEENHAQSQEEAATRQNQQQQPMPTANPFKLGNAHPTAFPVQNGATLAFQQALMHRQGSQLSGLPTSGLNHPQTPLNFPPGSGEKRKAVKRPSAPSGISMPPKSPRNISISSPRKMESVSPPSSPDHHHQQPEPYKARKSPRSPPVPSTLSSSSSTKPLKLALPGSSSSFPSNSPFGPGASSASSSSQPNPPLMHNMPNMKMPTGAISGRTVPSSMSLPISGALRQSAPLRYSTSGQSACAPMSMAARRAATVQNTRFKSVGVPNELLDTLSNDGGQTIVVDMRPHTAFVSQGRIKGSINVCVPSTLLRRPAFGLQKIVETLPSQKDRVQFSHAVGLETSPKLPAVDKILVIDTEINALTQESAINSLLSKLEKAGFQGELCWLKGGWNGLDRYLSNDQQGDIGEMGDKLNAYVDWDQLYEASESEDDMDVEQPSERMQDVKTPHQLGVPIASGHGTGIGGGLGARPSSGESSSSSLNSSSADSLLPSGYSSSSTSLDTQTNPSSLSAFDSNKMALPDLRSTSSPSESPDMIRSGSESGQSSSTTASKSSSTSSSTTTKPGSGSSTKPSVLRPMNLPMSAFQFGSTAAFSAVDGASGRRGTASAAASRPGSSSSTRATSPSGNDKKKPVYPTAAAAVGGLKSAGMKKQAANPFFDNIRQNIESTSLEQTLAHVQPFLLPEKFTRPSVQSLLPNFLQELIKLSPRARAEKLHREYFEIEQGERKRLQKVLDWHCQQSAVVEVERSGVLVQHKKEQLEKDGYHPFSISAGVEKGHLNRYKNMWPYEHARVRLAHESSETCGDYINASHIRLRGTNKTYIASQGPLESTTEHFWKLVLQENVNVIVMLTLLAEGGREKCSNYFQSGEYGSISIKLTKEVGDQETMKTSVNQEIGFFAQEDTSASKDPSGWTIENFVGPRGAGKSRLDSSTVRRTVEIKDKNDPPNTPPKVVRHIQYIRWPDFDIPPEPECVLELIAETSRAQEELDAVESPVLVHCSAGVGRTGTVDTLLERYRRERHPVSESPANISFGADYMDIDTLKRTTTPPSPARQSTRPRRAGSNGSNISNSEAIGNLTLDSDHESSPQPPSVSTFSSPPSQSQRKISHRHTGSTDSSLSPTALLARLERKDLQPQDYSDPIKSLVDQMREQRMSSVANAGQYVFTHLALLAGLVAELTEEGFVKSE